jgi:hypothetical protein
MTIASKAKSLKRKTRAKAKILAVKGAAKGVETVLKHKTLRKAAAKSAKAVVKHKTKKAVRKATGRAAKATAAATLARKAAKKNTGKRQVRGSSRTTRKHSRAADIVAAPFELSARAVQKSRSFVDGLRKKRR